MPPGDSPTEIPKAAGPLSRERTVGLALLVATGLAIYLCYRVVFPFFPALAWALALAVIATPGHLRMERRVRSPSVAAALSVVAVSLVIIAPLIIVTPRLVRDTTRYAGMLQQEVTSGAWRGRLDAHPRLKALVNWMESSAESPERPAETPQDAESEAVESRESPSDSAPQSRQMSLPYSQAASILTQGLASLMSGTVWLVMQLLVTLMTLFYFFRDRRLVLDGLRSLMPLKDREVDQVFARVSDTIHATIFGSLVVALVQGTMGGLIFWWLGFPAAVFWGAVMSMLAVVPTLGTFVVWVPAAVSLALNGQWGAALILAAWGGIAIALIDNLLYPWLVGERLRFHTLLVFLAIVGGLSLFGASGVILGPVVLALTDALIQIWKRRTSPLESAGGVVVT